MRPSRPPSPRVLRGTGAVLAVLGLAATVVVAGTLRRSVDGDVGAEATVVPPPLVFARTGDRVVSLDVARAEVAVSVPGAIGSTDGRLLFRVDESVGQGHRGGGGAAALVALDARTGVERRRQPVAAGFVPRLASHDGGAVVLVSSDAASSSVGYPAPRATTDLLVARAGGRPERHELTGNFEPEAFSLDGARLFLVEYVPAEAPTGYQVRQLDLTTGRVGPVESVDIAPGTVMGGAARDHVMAGDGSRLYTLYSVPAGVPDGLHGTDPSQGRAFLHVLDLDEGWAHCLLLPAPIGTDERSMASGPLAISPDGATLAVVDTDLDGGRSAVVEVDTETLTTGPVHEAVGPRWPGAAALDGAGNLYVAGAGGRDRPRVEVLDLHAGERRRGWSTATPVTAMSAQPGGTLVLAEPERGRVVVLRPGREGGRSVVLPAEGTMAVGPASVTLPEPRDVLECAC